MKIIKILLIQLFILTACNASNINAYNTNAPRKAPNAIKHLIEKKDTLCYTLYNFKKIWILETRCTEKKMEQGIYTVDALGIRKFPWYDPQFNKWVQAEGCNSKKDCYYKITTNTKEEITELIFYFYINVSEGYYKLKIKNNKLIVFEKKVINHPS